MTGDCERGCGVKFAGSVAAGVVLAASSVDCFSPPALALVRHRFPPAHLPTPTPGLTDTGSPSRHRHCSHRTLHPRSFLGLNQVIKCVMLHFMWFFLIQNNFKTGFLHVLWIA